MLDFRSNTVGPVRFMNQLALVRQQPFYAVLGLADYETQSAASFGLWLGTDFPVANSEAAGVAHGKYGELVSRGDPFGVCTTPVATYKRSYGWMGGIRYGNKIIAVSKLAQQYDLMMAVLGMYAWMGNDVEIHHLGSRFASRREMIIEARRLAVLHGTHQLIRPAYEHERIYVPVPSSYVHRGHYYLETQYDPQAPWGGVSHIDVVTSDPKSLLRFVASAYNNQPTIWDDADDNDPVGVFYVSDGQENWLGVMARPKFWDVENDW